MDTAILVFPGLIPKFDASFITDMGQGDKKSKKGKIWRGSYGNSRNKKTIKARLKRLASVKKTAVTLGDDKPKAARRTPARKKESA